MKLKQKPEDPQKIKLKLTCKKCGKSVTIQADPERVIELVGHIPMNNDGTMRPVHYLCARCRKVMIEECAERYITKHIGGLFAQARLSHFGDIGELKIQNFLTQRLRNHWSFYVTGNLGVGKTHFAAAITYFYATKYLKYIEDKYHVYVRGCDFKREGMLQPGTNIWEWYLESPVLIIDEIITQNIFDGERIWMLVDERYRNQRLTIGISNHSYEQVMTGDSPFEDWGAKIMSRLVRESDEGGVFILEKQKHGQKENHSHS